MFDARFVFRFRPAFMQLGGLPLANGAHPLGWCALRLERAVGWHLILRPKFLYTADVFWTASSLSATSVIYDSPNPRMEVRKTRISVGWAPHLKSGSQSICFVDFHSELKQLASVVCLAPVTKSQKVNRRKS